MRLYSTTTPHFAATLAVKRPTPGLASLPGEPIDVALRASLKKAPGTLLTLELASLVAFIWGGAGLNGILIRSARQQQIPLALPLVVVGQLAVSGVTLLRSLAIQREVNLLYYLQHGRPLFGFEPKSKIAKYYRQQGLPLLQAREKRVTQALTAGGALLGERAGKTLAVANGWSGVREVLSRLGGAGCGALGGHQTARVVNAQHRQRVQRQVLAALKLL